MIEQILDLTRSRLGGGMTIRPRPVDLGEAIVGIVEELRTAHPSRVIDLRCSSTLGVWDADRLEQVFSNIIGNALVHGDGSKPVKIELRSEADVVVFEVSNHGPPISDELRGKLFDPFRRGDRESRTSHTAGLGLGLYISNEIVVAHGGWIEVSSDIVQGTIFRVLLPRSLEKSAGEFKEAAK
jgi:sigma-B regulation protein RsbU (phosphoserine phosphatase)